MKKKNLLLCVLFFVFMSNTYSYTWLTNEYTVKGIKAGFDDVTNKWFLKVKIGLAPSETLTTNCSGTQTTGVFIYSDPSSSRHGYEYAHSLLMMAYNTGTKIKLSHKPTSCDSNNISYFRAIQVGVVD